MEGGGGSLVGQERGESKKGFLLPPFPRLRMVDHANLNQTPLLPLSSSSSSSSGAKFMKDEEEEKREKQLEEDERAKKKIATDETNFA